MKLLLGNGTIHWYQTNMVPIQKVQLFIMNEALHAHDEILISFDGKENFTFKQGMKVPEQYHELLEINLKITLKKKGKTVQTYTADPIIAKTYILLGEDATKIFPQHYMDLVERVKKLEKDTINLAKALKEIEETGEIF